MFDFSDPGSAQNRFCGSDLPRIGGIQNKHFYVSEGSQLIIWLKTNSGLKVGTGFQLDWRGYDCPTDKPNINQGTCEATCPDFNDQGTCVDKCPPGRVINAAEKTCDTTCPDQGDCVTTCPPNDLGPNDLLDTLLGTCVPTCPMDNPKNDQDTCVTDCPTTRPDDNNNMICGG